MTNEWLAKDTGRKVKIALHAKFAAGERTFTTAPLGYMRHPEEHNKLAIDPDTSWIIEKIFDLAAHGAGAGKITKILIQEKILTAGYINYKSTVSSRSFTKMLLAFSIKSRNRLRAANDP